MSKNNISTLFGKYRCEDKEKLLAELNINQTDEEELKYTLNKNQELVSSLFFKNTSEWKQDSGLMDAYKKAWPYSDMDYLKQQRDDYCFWENTSLSSKSNVTFFHPVKFIGLMEKIKIINLHAEELMRVQKRVMALKCLIMGARGIYDQDPNPSQTYCNHAAYLTIKALDKDYTQFTKGADCPPWDPNTFPENPHKSDYEGSNSLKTSNLWCDVLEYQANDESCPIKEVTAEEAQKLANMGYVVVVCWKNTKPTKSPHFATVAPDSLTLVCHTLH